MLKADKVFINGKIYSMAKEGEVFSAMAIRDGMVLAVGENDIAKRFKAECIVDLQGSAVLPGFNDTHQHILSYCQGLNAVDLRSATSIDELKTRMKEKVAATPAGEWVRGVCFDHEKFPDKHFPDKIDLDEISTDHPILVSRYCMHGYAANSMALKMAGIDENFVPDAENSVELGNDGKPTGVLWENAVQPILDILPNPLETYENKKDAIRTVCKDMSSYGITSTVPIQGKFCDAVEYIGLYQDLNKNGELPIRMYMGFDELPSFGMKTGFGDDMVKYGFYKIYSDGSMGSRAAALFEPYSDAPDVVGVLNYTQEEMDEMVQTAYDNDLQIAIHAIGDKGLDVAVSACEKAYFANPKEGVRFRLIHILLASRDLIDRMKKLPCVLDIQPKFLSSNLHWTEDRIGKERVKYAFAWKTLINEGFILTGGSDIPVDSYNPMLGIYSIVNRQDYSGFPDAGWYPEERVSMYEALSMYTKNGAYASFEEDIKGTLENGKYADFIVLSDDPFAIDPHEIVNVEVNETWLAGRQVFCR